MDMPEPTGSTSSLWQVGPGRGSPGPTENFQTPAGCMTSDLRRSTRLATYRDFWVGSPACPVEGSQVEGGGERRQLPWMRFRGPRAQGSVALIDSAEVLSDSFLGGGGGVRLVPVRFGIAAASRFKEGGGTEGSLPFSSPSGGDRDAGEGRVKARGGGGGGRGGRSCAKGRRRRRRG